VRVTITYSFATLICLMPPESGIPNPVGMAPELVIQKQKERHLRYLSGQKLFNKAFSNSPNPRSAVRQPTVQVTLPGNNIRTNAINMPGHRIRQSISQKYHHVMDSLQHRESYTEPNSKRDSHVNVENEQQIQSVLILRIFMKIFRLLTQILLRLRLINHTILLRLLLTSHSNFVLNQRFH